jgi:Leucine-rich repeat (LRR) protein
MKICQVTLCDDIHKDLTDEVDPTKAWKVQKHAVFKENQLTEIDKSIKLYPNLVELVLDKNQIESISNLSSLHYLSSLSLRGNRISEVANWHLLVGNLTKLNLSQNKIKKLEGFSKMYSLVNLDLSGNLIDDIKEVDHLGRLPCLENLRLTGNPVACSVGELIVK